MKKIILHIAVLCIASIACAQPCTEVDGLKPIALIFSNNGNPGTAIPVIPGNWNRTYKLDEVTGLLVGDGCIFPCCSPFGACVCYLTGTYFRRVTPPCDPTPCGGDLPLPGMPITNNNNPSGNWSQSSTWAANQVPVITSSAAIVLSKPVQIDADLNFSNDHWLILTTGSSTILAGKTVTDNAAIKIYAAASLENFGSINGNGQVLGTLINSGSLSPGNSPGKFTIAGNYTATATAIHQIEIASATSYDTISVAQDVSYTSGNAVLNGALNVTLLNGYSPSLGDAYKIFTFASSIGNFTSASLPSLAPGLIWSVSYNATDVTLSVIAGSLPIHFTNVNAYPKGNGVQVEWVAENEVNVKKYEIEKSVDGRSFNLSGTVNTNGGANPRYSWFDINAANGNNYYRIKEIDVDGKFMYSAIMLVKISGDKKITIYPNPVKRGESLQVSLQNLTASKIEIINAVGNIVYSNALKLTGAINIPVSASLAPGQYMIRIISENNVEIKKVQIY
jgi:hypothetical protein